MFWYYDIKKLSRYDYRGIQYHSFMIYCNIAQPYNGD